MGGEERDPQGLLTKRQRHFGFGCGAEPGGDAGNDGVRNARLAQRRDFLAAAPENERIAALEPHRALAGARRFDQQCVGRVLSDAGLADAAPHRHPRRIAPRTIEHLGRHQIVVEHDIGILQRAQRLDRQKIGIARPGANQRDEARAVLGREGGWIDDGLQRGFGIIRTTGQNRRADRTIDHALPESPPQRHIRNAIVNGFAPASDEAGEITDARGQQCLDAFAHAPRHHRRCPTGADRDHDIAAIDDGRENECRVLQVVHYVDRQTDSARTRGHRLANGASTGAQHRDDIGKIGLQRIAVRAFEARQRTGIETQDIVIAIGCEPAHPRASRHQQPQFCARQFTSTDQNDRSGLQIEKHGQKAHRNSASPTPGLTEIIFYLSIVKLQERENYFFYFAAQL